jgi:penicillin amidase/acyl-homoserine-lactone acylase
MRILKWIGLGLVGLMLLALLAAGGVILADRAAQPGAPDLKPLIARAGAYHVRIRRDEWGVPHVLGSTDPDVAFGIGFAHSEDDFASIQEAALTSRGTLAAYEGKAGATTDYLVRLMRVNETVARGYGALPADLRAVLQAYADGVNYYGALHRAKVAPGMLPLTGQDVAAGFVFKTPFFYGLDDTLRKLMAPTHRRPMAPIGSNGVAVAPSRSADGATRLLVNSHQPYKGTVAWYEAVLESGTGWHVAGGFFPGTPFMLHGVNAHLGWANTVNSPRLADVYRLAVNPANAGQYRLDGRWRNFETSDAAIRVKLLGPLFWTFHRQVLWSAHGPVVSTDHGLFAFRFAGIGETRQTLQYYRLNKAANLGEWRSAMALQALPSINYIYADETGTIGYVYNGLFPDRKAGLPWQGVLAGDRSDLIWRSYLPFEKVPQIWRPSSGFVFNSNNTPFQATGPADALKPADFAPTMGLQTDMTNRAWRALETFGADSHITEAAFRTYKFDLAYSARSDMAKIIAAVLALDPKGDGETIAAQKLLRAWDRRTDVASRAAALAILTALPVADAVEAGKAPDVRPSLTAAMAKLKARFGRIDPKWGDVNRIIRGKLDLPIDGGPDTFRAVYGQPLADGRLKAVAGDTFIMFVAWDRAGRMSAQSIHQFGSATTDEASPHYADQTPLFVAMKTKPVLFTEDELAGHVREDYAPGARRVAQTGRATP